MRIDGLQARPELNGRCGVARRFDVAKGRYEVLVEGEAEPLLLKPANLLDVLPAANEGEYSANEAANRAEAEATGSAEAEAAASEAEAARAAVAAKVAAAPTLTPTPTPTPNPTPTPTPTPTPNPNLGRCRRRGAGRGGPPSCMLVRGRVRVTGRVRLSAWARAGLGR